MALQKQTIFLYRFFGIFSHSHYPKQTKHLVVGDVIFRRKLFVSGRANRGTVPKTCRVNFGRIFMRDLMLRLRHCWENLMPCSEILFAFPRMRNGARHSFVCVFAVFFVAQHSLELGIHIAISCKNKERCCVVNASLAGRFISAVKR